MEEKRSIGGLLVMDTNSFLYYLEGGRQEKAHYDYQQVKKFVEQKNLLVVITPYTLYECIQGCDSMERFQNKLMQMCKLWDFNVLNMNGILGKESTFYGGVDYLFPIRCAEEFYTKKFDLRVKIDESLMPRYTLLAQLIAVMYLLITEQEDDGKYSKQTETRIKLMMSKYFQKEKNFWVQLYSLSGYPDRQGVKAENGELVKTKEDAKDKLFERIQGFALQVLLVTKVQMEELTQGKRYDLGEYNGRIIQEDFKYAGEYEASTMRKRYKEWKKRNNGKLSINRYVDQILQGESEVFKNLYKKVLTDWFEMKGSGKELKNTIIDYVNAGVFDLFPNNTVICMTEERKINEMLLGVKDERARLTQEFYRRFYKD